MLQIYVGSLTEPTYYFEDDQIFEVPSSQAVALVGQELSIDTFAPVVADSFENTHDILMFRSADGRILQLQDTQLYAIDVQDAENPTSIINIPDGTPIWYYRDQELIGKFYIDTVKRLAKNKYQLNSVSAIGRLDKMWHGGGIFTAAKFGTVLRHILAAGLNGDGAPVIEYAIDDNVADLTVSGWLPHDTKRNNLYQLIFSHGVNIIKNHDGNPHFTFLYTSGEAAELIPDDKIFYGGNVEYIRPYSSVSIMEHTYSRITSREPVTLYDNTEGGRISNEEIWFDQAPVITSTLATMGDLMIVKANENGAILSGNGKLTGVPYTHTTRTVSRINASWDLEKTASVQKCTMVNEINSENLLNRLFSFFCPPDYIKKIKNEIIFTTQRCGKTYAFSNPYGEKEAALLAKMENRASSFNRAACEFYAGYDPVGQAGLFQHCIILDKETFENDGGVFVLPDDVFAQEEPQIRVVMIAGGTGGWSGWPGENGKDAHTYTNVEEKADISAMWYGAEGGNGGKGGAGGDGGRTFVITIKNPQASYSYTIGDGGEGGAATGFIPDTFDELKSMLELTDPDNEYSDSQINALLAQEQALTTWTGSPNRGQDGTATTFGDYSTDDPNAYVPTAGVYNSLFGKFYAIKGSSGYRGGKGGARKVESNGAVAWTTDGESIHYEQQISDDMWLVDVYEGGTTGVPLTEIPDLPEAKFTAYGGNGAGAAVGIGRTINTHMDGGSDQEYEWEVVENEPV